ncbi:MAG: YkgJ family cysteine cluster protein, partial [Euryarchaeota archaeon]|nr:YkgJ family cysteine cluster protein [Euryarchaeota archaeon]
GDPGEGGDVVEFEIAGLVIAGRFFRLGRARVASPEKCRRCGECCRTIGRSIRVSPSDIERWIAEGRDEILALLDIREEGGELLTGGELRLGDERGRCVFLEDSQDGSICRIHETKPEVCAEYPLNCGSVCKGGVDFREQSP